MAKIIFYEDKNFQGHSYESTSDCPDLQVQLSRCNSIRVESGCFMIYEQPNYMGQQYFLNKGEYSDFQQWMGLNDSIKSCHVITSPHHQKGSKIKIYEREALRGQVMEYVGDSSEVHDCFQYHNVSSCNVLERHWQSHSTDGSSACWNPGSTGASPSEEP
ncbi:gamma-crystallin M2-like [Malaclemys terrapin pileata]|uniref:gamma-crystallin M2-like n=1 Tax=Malaclemys terrapin pileata TaxID=2991368 RepID=UPI0023A89378|nr:gamma-crystallin M2-like [Malaclemys terrapin pileata]